MENQILTPNDIARIFNISKHTVYKLINNGELRAFKVGNRFRIERSEVERMKKMARVKKHAEPN